MTDTIQRMQSRLNELRFERARIDAEILEIESALKVVLRYSGGETSLEQGSVNVLYQMVSAGRPTKQQRIVELAKAILSDGRPRHTVELAREIERSGVEITDMKDRLVPHLSAYLSREKGIFSADRRTGWSLKQQAPEGAATPSGAGDLL